MIFNGSQIKVFILSHRTTDPKAYWDNILKVADLCQKYAFTGLLLFEGNDTFISPWVAAQEVLARTESISPLIAVNPIYLHPFKAAKIVSSLAQIYNRKIYLNMITGTAVNYLDSMNDSLSHDERYERIAEYIVIMRRLLSSVEPVSWNGNHYAVENLQLLPGIPGHLMPEFLLSGQSDAARKVVQETGSVGTQMLAPDLSKGLNKAEAINFGILCRSSEALAWNAAELIFPDNEEDQLIQELSMSNTDSSWKRRMAVLASLPDNRANGYWMGPFRNFRSDGPYLVGSYSSVGGIIADLIRSGVSTFIFDITPNEEEYAHISHALGIAEELLGS
jgi:alkanesulfonate monooxygenase